MMNDRFSSQLRQYLLETADERPAEGQLATVIDGVAVTRQRPSLVARLTWMPGRIGLFPSVAVRYGLVALALVAAMAAAVILAGGSRSTVFEGTWTSIDPIDLSTQFLVVGAGLDPSVHFEDLLATGGACDFDAVKHYKADGTGEIAGSRLEVVFPDGGGCLLMKVEMLGFFYDHQATSDTLVDKDGLEWVRVQGGARPATQAPQPEPAATDASPAEPVETEPGATEPAASEPAETEPAATEASASDLPLPSPNPTSVSVDPDAVCFDIPAGETYRQSVGGLSLALTVPATSAFEWQRYRDGFEVAGNCHFAGPVLITASIVELIVSSCGDTVARPASTAVAIDWLTESADYTTAEPTQLTIGGHAATRFEVFGSTYCPAETELWAGAGVGGHSRAIVYIVDVGSDGVPLGIVINNVSGDGTPEQIAEADAMVAAMEIEP